MIPLHKMKYEAILTRLKATFPIIMPSLEEVLPPLKLTLIECIYL
jgi:hypothetical protein